MSERDIIEATPTPSTQESLMYDFQRLGIEAGMTLVIHSSLRSLGWVCGGAQSVIQALMETVTDQGTVIMPAHTSNYSDPAQWNNPPVPQEWLPTIYEAMPAFDPSRTSSFRMGQIAETFRTYPNVLRSNHPHVSFSAWGKHAEYITAGHSLNYGLGENSPLARIYDLNGSVLLLGVGYNRNTSFHLAEYRIPGSKEEQPGAPIYENGQRVWKWYRDIELNSDIFPEIGTAFEEAGYVKTGQIALAQTRLFSQRSAIDFAVEWYKKQRQL